MNVHYKVELEILMDELARSLSRLERVEELMSSTAGPANDAIAMKLHEVAQRLSDASMKIVALARSIKKQD